MKLSCVTSMCITVTASLQHESRPIDSLSPLQVMWFSSGGTKSVVHNDDVDNINCLFSGTKELLFISYKKYKGKVGFRETHVSGVGEGYLGQVLLGMCRWLLRTPTPL